MRPAAGDQVTVDLGRVREIGGITLAMAKPGSTGDYLHDGVLEYSADGQTWQQLTAFSGKPDVTATVPAGTKVRYVRARATAGQTNWLVVREFAHREGGRCGGRRTARRRGIRPACGGRRRPRHRLPGGARARGR
ncbi:discoidin domain-containing protein [Streptomyces yanii]|uniref:discoidin domain-containing protein n=1 Tax=Streptomyces yanii TaxID=78510 RepID=UPI0031EF8A1B